MSESTRLVEAAIRSNYTLVCKCEWEDHGYDEVIVETSKSCVIHGDAPDPLDGLLAENANLLERLEEVKRLASDPFASEAVALRACLLTAYEGLGLPGPQPSPERDIAKAVIDELMPCTCHTGDLEPYCPRHTSLPGEPSG